MTMRQYFNRAAANTHRTMAGEANRAAQIRVSATAPCNSILRNGSGRITGKT